MDSIAKRPRTRLSPLKRKQQLMEIALEVFARRGIGVVVTRILQRSLKFLLRRYLTTSLLVKIWWMKF